MTTTAGDRIPALLLFGATGQVGLAVHAAMGSSWRIVAPPRSDVSLDDPERLASYVRASGANAVVNAAAYTRVDDAEQDVERVRLINAAAPAAMAAGCADLGARFIHLSTDYVFDGSGSLPYAPDAAPQPLNVYGRTKAMGEQLVLEALPDALVLRTAWVHSGHGTNFVATAVRRLVAEGVMRVVDDQVGTPTAASTIASVIGRALEMPSFSGIQHVTDAGVASWYDVAGAVAETLQVDGIRHGLTVVPVSSAEFPRPARRPAVSLLDTTGTRRALGWSPPFWRDGVVASTRAWCAALSSSPRNHA